MADKRMITGSLLEDEFIGGLDGNARWLWMGLLLIADDQGRIENNLHLIRAKVFIYQPDYTIDNLQADLDKMVEAGKICRYEAGKKTILQITNWWKHQNLQWAQPSKHPAPEGWIDRERYHAPGNYIKSRNWDQQGGFSDTNEVPNKVGSEVGSTVGSEVPYPIEERRGEERRVYSGEIADNPKIVINLEQYPDKSHVAIQAFREVSKRYPVKPAWKRIIEALGDTPDVEKLRHVFETWCSKGFNPENVDGILSWYVRGIPEFMPGKPIKEIKAYTDARGNQIF